MNNNPPRTIRQFKSALPLIVTLVCVIPHISYSQKAEIYVSSGHSSAVGSLALSPDGKTLASGSYDNTVRLWSLPSGQELKSLKGHSGVVRSLAFSADGKKLASGSRDHTIRLWDLSSREMLRTLGGYSGWGNPIAFSPDGNDLLSKGNDGGVTVWNLASGDARPFPWKPRSGSDDFFAVSPDGKTLAINSYVYSNNSSSESIKILEAATGRELKSLEGSYVGIIYAGAFSPDGNRLAVVRGGNSLELWDVAAARELRLDGHSAWVLSAAFSPDGKTLASGGADSTIKLWDATSGKELKTFRGHSAGVSSVAFSPDGKALISGSADKTIKIWDSATGRELKTLSGHSGFPYLSALSNNGTRLASVGNDNTITLRKLDLGQETKTLAGHSDIIHSLVFSADGTSLASGSDDGTIKLWNAESGRESKTLKGPSSSALAIAFSPSGRTIASGGHDTTIKLWDVDSGRQLQTLQVPGWYSVYSLAFSPDGKTLASVSHENDLKLWDVAGGREKISSKEETTKDVFRGSFILGQRYSASAAYSPDGRTIITGSIGSIRLWNVKTGTELKNLSGSGPVAFSPDGKSFVGMSGDNTIKMWDAATGRELKELKGHSTSVRSVAFTRDGKTLVSGSHDNVKLWDVTGGNELASLLALDEKNWVVVTPSGRFDGSDYGMKLISYRQDDKLLPLESFFDEFFTPNLLQKIYSREPLPPARAKVDFSKRIKLPPEVRITSPKPGSESSSDHALITVEANDQGGGVEDIRLYHNGKRLGDDAGRQLTQNPKANTATFAVSLLPGVNTFRATAFNSDRTEAVPDEIKIELKAVEASANLYILAVGLNEYKNARYNLNYGNADAKAFADAVERKGKNIFKEIKKKVLLDAEASQAGIRAEMEAIAKAARPQDVFVFFFAGHGKMSEPDVGSAADFFLVPYDVVNITGDGGSLIAKGIAAAELREMSRKISALKQLIVIDACESEGAVATLAMMRGPEEEKAIQQLARSAGVAVLASAGQNQVATEFKKLGHGVFTYALLQGLNGAADGAPMDGKVTVNELRAYLDDQVPELTKIHRGKPQYPNSFSRGQDFPIGVNR